jgi:hypothetical protein
VIMGTPAVIYEGGRFESYLGSQIIKLQVGFELNWAGIIWGTIQEPSACYDGDRRGSRNPS